MQGEKKGLNERGGEEKFKCGGKKSRCEQGRKV